MKRYSLITRAGNEIEVSVKSVQKSTDNIVIFLSPDHYFYGGLEIPSETLEEIVSDAVGETFVITNVSSGSKEIESLYSSRQRKLYETINYTDVIMNDIWVVKMWQKGISLRLV